MIKAPIFIREEQDASWMIRFAETVQELRMAGNKGQSPDLLGASDALLDIPLVLNLLGFVVRAQSSKGRLL